MEVSSATNHRELVLQYRWKVNPILKSLGSVKLAVLTMLVFGGVVAAGTVIESRYNSDLAKIVIYQAPWFLGILAVLFANIFVATLLRWPFKRHHTGFVITHLGLLTLLIGSMVTAVYGIDGSMRIIEGGESNQVMLPDFALELAAKDSGTAQVVDITRASSVRGESSLRGVNAQLEPNLRLLRFEPFVLTSTVFRSHPSSEDLAVQFAIKSPFFDVTESLTTTTRPFLRMGPALFRLVAGSKSGMLSGLDAEGKKTAAHRATIAAPAKALKKASNKRMIQFVDAKTREILAETSLEGFLKAPLSVRGLVFQVGRQFRNATVGTGGVEERDISSEGGTSGTGGANNPALEIKAKKGEVSFREVLFEKYPDFSLHPEGIEGVKVVYLGPLAAATSESAAGSSTTASAEGVAPNDAIHGGMAASASKASNEVQFRPLANGHIEVELKKNGEVVLKKEAAIGDTIETPWMGMKLTLKSMVRNAVEDVAVQPTEPVMRQDLPPSAVLVQLEKGFPQLPFYLVEGESRDIRIRDRDYQIYYGRKVIELPFRLRLDKFTKVDYPGTQTAMSYESEVAVNQEGRLTKISMNEPLSREGYTLYQASFQMGQGQQTASILSVNRDPGRILKYLGSLIAAIGIVTYTLMRSRLARKAKAA